MRAAIVLVCSVVILAGCRSGAPPVVYSPLPLTPLRTVAIQEQLIGKGTITIGMTKAEVLAEITRSREPHQPIPSEPDSYLYVFAPEESVIRADMWQLTCPSRDARRSGSGGILLRCTFKDGKVAAIERLPWQ